MDMVRNVTSSKNGTSIFDRLAVSAILLLSLCRVADAQDVSKPLEFTLPAGTMIVEILNVNVRVKLDEEKGNLIVLQDDKNAIAVAILPEKFPAKPGDLSEWTTLSTNDLHLIRYRLKRGETAHVLGLARTFDKGGSVYDLDISADGQRVLLAGDIPNPYIMLWEPQTGKALKRFDTELPPTNVAMTPDGKIGAFGSLSDMAQILDLETGEVLHRLPHQTFILGIAFSPDGKLLATGGVDHAICIWNVESGEELLRIREHTDWVTRVVFLPNGQLVSSSADQTVRIWDPKEGTEIRKIEHSEPVWSLNASADGKYLITGLGGRSIENPSVPWVTPAKENTAFVWATETGKQVQKLSGHTGAIMGASITPDGKRAVTSAFDKTLRLWDVATGKELQKLDYESMQWTVQFARDGQSLVTVGGAYRAPGDDVTTQSPQERVHLYGLGVLAKDLKRTAEPAPVKMIKVLAIKPLKSLKKESTVYSATFLPDGKKILAGGGSANQAVDVWEIATDQKLLSLDAGDACNFIAVSPDGALAAAAGVSDGRIAILDLNKEVVQHQIQHGDAVTRVRFTHDGKRLVASGTDGTISIWDTETFRLLKRIAAHDGPVFSFAILPDNTKVISGGADGVANCWDIESGEILFNCKHDSPVWSLEISPDGKFFATGTGGQVVGGAENLQVEASDDNVIRLWSTADGRRSSELRAHTQAVCALAFTPDSKFLISGSYDRTIRTWNLEDRRQTGATASQGWITSLSVSPDGSQLLASGGAYKSRGEIVEFIDERVRLFELEQVEQVARNPVARPRLDPARIVRAPANVQARARAPEPKSKNDLKRIGLAFHNYHDVHRRFPAARIIGEDGQTPHSWRVAILPYLGEEYKALHDSYRFDEPWDSEHNKQLIEKIPSVYQSESDPKSTNAAYFVPTGPETMFPSEEDAQGTRIREILDGTTNTIMAVQAKRDIPWTKPDDLPCDDLEKLPEFGGVLKEGCWILLADGSVRMVPNDLAAETRRILLTKAGGEVVPNNADAAPVAPQVAPARRPAAVVTHRNNLKRIALAMHNYHDKHHSFPQASIIGPDGRTPHSWRIALLPFFDDNLQELYDSYHFDEPWDSEHNKTLIDKMPAVYRSPNAKPDSKNSAYFLPIGEETIFPANAERAMRIRDVRDGTSNTIMVLEAQRDIPWTKPEDIPVALDQEVPKLGEEGEKRFHAALADGSVHLLDVDIEAGILWSLLTRASGEAVRLPR